MCVFDSCVLCICCTLVDLPHHPPPKIWVIFWCNQFLVLMMGVTTLLFLLSKDFHILTSGFTSHCLVALWLTSIYAILFWLSLRIARTKIYNSPIWGGWCGKIHLCTINAKYTTVAYQYWFLCFFHFLLYLTILRHFNFTSVGLVLWGAREVLSTLLKSKTL